MLRYAADENFHDAIVQGLRLRVAGVDVMRVQDAGLLGATDPTILEWAAAAGRILLTHDVSTMSVFAYQRIEKGLPMPGVFEVSDRVPIGRAIEELVLMTVASAEGEWNGKVTHLPL